MPTLQSTLKDVLLFDIKTEKEGERKMQTEKVKVSDLIEYRFNAKVHPDWQIEQIKKSIEEYGYNDLITIDENNTIIEGHGDCTPCKNWDTMKLM